VQVLASVNLVAQVLLMALVTLAVYFARKKKLIRHCNIVRVSVVIQLITIAVVMAPALIGYLDKQESPGFNMQAIIHHSLGLIVVLVWIYVNLAVARKIKRPARLLGIMRTAYVLWFITFVWGIALYVQVYML
jgi:putative membrane protein